MDSESIVFERYILKNIPILFNKREVKVSIIPLNKKILILFKKSPKKIYE